MVLTVVAVLTAASCGDDDDGAATTEPAADTTASTDAPAATDPADTAPAQTDPAGTAPADGDAALPPTPANVDGVDLDRAHELVLEGLAPATFEAPGPAFDMAQVTKPVWFITATSQFPVVPIVNAAFEEAATAAGVEYNICPGESTTERNALCIQQAIDAGAGSILFFSQDPASIAEPLEAAQAAGIKIVSGNNALRIGDPPDPNTDFSVSHDYYGTGVLNAAYAVAKYGADLQGLCITLPEFKVTESACEGFEATVTELCPTCTVLIEGAQVAQFVDQITAITNTAVLENPDLNFVFGSVDDVAGPVIAQLERMGKTPDDVGVGGQNGTNDALQNIKDGNFMVVTAGQNAQWWGWAFFDATARAQVDGALDSAAIRTAPNQLFTTESFTYDGEISYENAEDIYGYPGGALFRDGFQALWNG
jgi:ribose transport system substrate-binding protein